MRLAQSGILSFAGPFRACFFGFRDPILSQALAQSWYRKNDDEDECCIVCGAAGAQLLRGMV